MRKFLHLILLVISSVSFALEDPSSSAYERAELSFDSKEPLFVSLGADCGMGGNLIPLGFRRASFPFDWLLTLDHKGMVELLNDDFKYFLDPRCYAIHPNGSLVNTYYHMEFRHEHDNDFIGKYERRVERFRKLNTYSGKVFFMRKSFQGANDPSVYCPSKDLLNISLEHALELNQGLKKRFPNLDFNLVILNFFEEKNKIELIDNILIFYIEGDVIGLPRVMKTLLKFAEDPLPFHYLFFDKPSAL